MIACLGWGSLIWDPGDLPVEEQWFEDGPALQMEFARQSSDGRLTLVLLPTGTEVRSLWARFCVANLGEARRALAKREGVSEKDEGKYIATWTRCEKTPGEPAGISAWATARDLDAVVWAALPPRFRGQNGRAPTVDEAVQYLRELPEAERRNAERYIRMAPRQIDTLYRRRFERELGWTPFIAS